MQSLYSGENNQQEDNHQCATYIFPASRAMPSTMMSDDLSSVTRDTQTTSATVFKGHARSASHGAVGTGAVSSASSVGVIGRPSALKQNRGHQRAFSQGQISDGGTVGFQKGHSRVSSKTDFILPPGHRDTESIPGAGSVAKTHGHSRQASRSESIYTLRQSGTPNLWTQFQSYVLRRGGKTDVEGSRCRTVVPNHLVPPHTPKKLHPNGKSPDNKIRTTKYTLLSFLPKNLLEQFHRVANLYFIFIVLLNWFPAINAFGKEIAMIPVLFVLGVTAIKDLFEDRRRHASDKRINNSTCRVYRSEEERYKKTLWKKVRVGDLVHLSNNEVIPADILLLRSSDPNGICYIDSCNLDGETNLKQRQVARGFVEKQSLLTHMKRDLVQIVVVEENFNNLHGFSKERRDGDVKFVITKLMPVSGVKSLSLFMVFQEQDIFEPCKFRSVVEVDGPTTKIYRFHGSIVHPDGERVPVSTDNLLLRDCMVKNTDFVEGIVVYAGHETKAMLNNGGPRYKRSNLERQMNLDIIWCVLILIVLCVIGAAGCKLWLSSYDGISVPPFIPSMQNSTTEGILSFWTFVIILQIMIPLSLYVTIEMAKLIQVYHIHNDVNLYDPETNKRIECRALNIPEELGQVQYIFSDKTGTLTENKMIFRRCTVGGIDYNHPPPENIQKLKTRPGVPLPLLVNPRLQEELEAGARPSVHSQRLQEFLLLLAVCNTVVVSQHPHHDIMNASGVIEQTADSLPGRVVPTSVPTSVPVTGCLPRVDTAPAQYTLLSESRSVTPSPPPQPCSMATASPLSSSPGSRPKVLGVPSLLVVRRATTPTPSPCELKPIFEAESPDELALVDAAYSYGCRLVKRSPQVATVSMPGQGALDFEILKILPFDSARKCMSVVLKHPVSHQKILFCKGADSTILPNLAPTDDVVMQQHIFRTQQHLNSYARQGLRVLVMARRTLTDAEFLEWQRSHVEAELAVEGRERKLRESFSRLESNLTLLGATGIEDRLQEGVPETIAALISAGIVVWVLTGDKPETAINVAYSARLFQPQMELIKLSARSRDQAESAILFYLSKVQQESSIGTSSSSTSRGLNQVGVFTRPSAGNGNIGSSAGLRHAMVVDGKTLTYILDRRSNLQKPFLKLTQYCTSVLCCRTTPLQKAYIVRIVKEQLKMRTLAIGDGANDVSMIQTADVGIGISGQEGRQAVMASDFALSRFKFLGRLLLVHGHWCYDRLARMVLYFFYKNATFVFLIFWYQLYCGFSGAVMIDQMYLMLYNLLFTSLPPIAIGVYDQDVPEQILLAQPSLYNQGRLGLVYQPHSFWVTMADSLYQSIVIFFICEAAYHNTEVGIWEFGTTVTTSCMFVMLCHVAIETRSWTVIHLASILLSITAFYVFSLVYNTVCLQCFGLPSNYWVIQQTIGSSIYWASVFLSTVMALLPRFVWRVVETTLFPKDVVRAVLDHKVAARRGEGFLVSWSRSTSTSSIFRNADFRPKHVTQNSLTAVG